MDILKPFKKNKIVYLKQLESSDCGPTCLKIICLYFGRDVDIKFIRNGCYISKNGVNLLDLITFAEKELGFNVYPTKLSIENLIEQNTYPCLLHWGDNHYVILEKFHKGKFHIANPSIGKVVLSKEDFSSFWNKNEEHGIAVFFEPNKSVNFQNKNNRSQKNYIIPKHFFTELSLLKYKFLLVFILLLIISLMSTIFPKLHQEIIDTGIINKDKQFILFILLSQIALYTGVHIFEYIQGFIFLKISKFFNVNLIVKFINNLTILPLIFFDKKLSTDILSRINEHSRIEDFFSSNTLNFIISIILFIIYSTYLTFYSTKVYIFFIIISICSISYVIYSNKKRKHIDYTRFEKEAINKNNILEIVNGILDLKLNNAVKYQVNKWKVTELELFDLKRKSFKIQLKQDFFVSYISNIKNTIIIIYLSILTIDGDITLGVLLSVSFILGQITIPIENFVQFIYSYQDAKISMDRLSDVYSEPIEPNGNISNINPIGHIEFKNVNFSYYSPNFPLLFENLNLKIPFNKTTAIVGSSGSGKTTLLKILLKYYSIEKGEILINNINLNDISNEYWRNSISTVFQDGYIFSDTIEYNVTLGNNSDKKKLEKVLSMSNCLDFINQLPQKEKTKIGNIGIQLSKGQIQRILIARAMYKNPQIIFLDEATSALDAENEKFIYNSLQTFLKNKTAIIIAHRLSTVKNADQIIVLKKGEIVEQGNHKELISKKGEYYNLVKNQLELGNE